MPAPTRPQLLACADEIRQHLGNDMVIVVDMTDLIFCDGGGLEVIYGIATTASERDGTLALIRNPPAVVRRIAEVLRLDDLRFDPP